MQGEICTNCGFETPYEKEMPVFCARCGNRLRTGNDYEDALKKALDTDDYALRFSRLTKLRDQYPGAYEIELEILSIGRLYEKGGKPDFYRIPYWPLCAFETPNEFSKKERGKMLAAFFENPAIGPVLALAPDENTFWQDYLMRMARGYVEVFIRSNTSNSMFLGFRRKKSDIMRRSAQSLAGMLARIEKSEYPDQAKREKLIGALKRAFQMEFSGEDALEMLASFLRKK